MPKAKQYKVMNPNLIAERIPLIAWVSPDGKKYDWYEGDTVTIPKGMDPKRLLRDGYIVEA